MTEPVGGADSSTAALAAAVVAGLRDRSQTLATAESLTGGLVGATLTGIPGASVVYRGGLITYATELKAGLARVSALTLAAHGPVAPSTAAELARGAADVCGADWGLATTGVAGPEPQDGHPVGQVFVAIAPPASSGGRDDHRSVEVRELALTGDRSMIRDQTTRAVLQLLLETLRAARPDGCSTPPGVET
ncbi:MAG TPA: CinA family protein [Microlunatus sp.]